MILKNFSFENNYQSVEYIIYGKVQGVGYRFWLKGVAENLNVNGWVKNKSDGTVSGIFYGSEKSIEKTIEACYEGPKFAKVEKIIIKNV